MAALVSSGPEDEGGVFQRNTNSSEERRRSFLGGRLCAQTHPPRDAPRHTGCQREPDSSASLRLQPHREPCLKASDLAAQPASPGPGPGSPHTTFMAKEQSPRPRPPEQSGDAAPAEDGRLRGLRP